ncbi:MAG: 3-hydroxyisobutyrate dehydrogenase [Pseudomonadota bacterium]
MSTVGFIGLGNMGLPMAANLVKAGHEVLGFDANAEILVAAGEQGIMTCAGTADVVSDADTVISMLPNGEIVLSVWEEIIPNCKPGTLLIDCSTIDVESARKAHDMAKNAGMGSIDCPVSGGITGAAAGTLTFMIGGSDTDVDRARPFLDIMGGKQVHVGEGGAGQAAKICNNMLLAVSMIGTSEAFSLGKKLGLDPQALFDVMSTSSGSCWSINAYCPVPGVGPQSPADNEYKPGFAASLMIKDITLAQQAAEAAGQATPLGRHARELYKEFAEHSGKDLDFSGIITWLENKGRADG